ncbi:YolD-like family protein [Lihuaxuella thermophila]|uniref:YolD-like family protein n=1 Tax=Lihuaxuella thermophila TaxID=1173111 RepID=UPI0014798D98|nr:YolD-like family protein [Lihuaxuella thermophila]
MNILDFYKWIEENRFVLPVRHEKQPKSGHKQKKYQPPVIDEDQLEYMSFILEEAFDMKKPVLVTYAGRYSPLQFYGRISKINPYEGWFVIVNGEIRKKIPYTKLMDVDWF